MGGRGWLRISEAFIPQHGPDLNGRHALQQPTPPQTIPSHYEYQVYAMLEYLPSRT